MIKTCLISPIAKKILTSVREKFVEMQRVERLNPGRKKSACSIVPFEQRDVSFVHARETEIFDTKIKRVCGEKFQDKFVLRQGKKEGKRIARRRRRNRNELSNGINTIDRCTGI